MLALWITALFTACEAATATWDLDAPCQEHIKKFADTQAKMVKCATSWSSPPKVCTNCIDQYIEFKQMEYLTHHLDNVTSLDNTTCTKVIYANYLLSYVYEISNALTKRVWDTSRCDDCLVITWDFEHGNSTIEYDSKTIEFQALLYGWRDCVSNYTDANANASTICDRCGQSFDDLFDYYWKIYTNPATEFCVDVETTMNDTMNLWHNVWRCPDDGRSRDRHHDATVVAFAATILVIVIGLFYAGSYVQTEHAERNLIRYSRMEAPRGGPRSRLLSSSTVDSPLSAYTATTTTSVRG